MTTPKPPSAKDPLTEKLEELTNRCTGIYELSPSDKAIRALARAVMELLPMEDFDSHNMGFDGKVYYYCSDCGRGESVGHHQDCDYARVRAELRIAFVDMP